MALPIRRESIAKLTSPLSSSPYTSPRGLVPNSYNQNSNFLKPYEDAVDSSSNSDHHEDEAVPDFSIGIDDPKLVDTLSKHLPKASLASEGADITRELHRLNQELRPGIRRTQSWTSETSSRRGSMASSLNVPGGFRRAFVKTRQPNILTRNFVEFLSIYGHFAGEDLEDEDAIACHYKITPDETSALTSTNPNATASDKKAYFLLLKAFVGTGVLFLPKAFSNGGLAFSITTLLFFGLLSYWCYLTLVLSKNATKVSSFGEIGLKLYGSWLQRLILFSIVVSQIGFVAAYIVFTSENLRAFVNNIAGQTFNIVWFTVFQVALLVPLALIRDITKLSLLAVLANGFIFFGLVTIIYFLLEEWLVGNGGNFGPNIEFYVNQGEFSLFIGVAIFAFEGIGLIIPIQESMIHPSHFPKVLFQVLATISFIFVFIGTLGYLTFGSDIKTVILLNLPQNSPMVIMIQLLYSLAILLSTPLQLFPAIRLLENKIFKRTGKRSLRVKWQKNTFRSLFVIFTAFIAYVGGQNLDKFISFVGCFACIPLVYMYPPLLHLKSCCALEDHLDNKEKRKRYWLGRLDIFLAVLGGVAMTYTTYNVLAN